MKNINILLTSILVFLCGISCAKAVDYDYYCTKEAASQLAKIVYHEVNASTIDSNEDFFLKISTAAVAINNANRKDGNTFYEQIYNLTNDNYRTYSTYKDASFESEIPSQYRGKYLYIAEQVLTGKYTFPSNMTLQASQSEVKKYGPVWKEFLIDKSNDSDLIDVNIGYENQNLVTTDIYGNEIINNTTAYYQNLANSLEKSDYSAYTVDTVCSGNSYPISNNNSTGGNSTTQQTTSNTAFGVCENPDILRVIYFFLIIVDIVKIIIPIALIVFGLIDFSKAVITSDEKVQQKTVSLFLKRLLYAVLVFAVPWIIEVLMVTLGDLLDKDNMGNFTNCLENANSECIEALDSENVYAIKSACDVTYECYYCVNGSEAAGGSYVWGDLDNPYCKHQSSYSDKNSCLAQNN